MVYNLGMTKAANKQIALVTGGLGFIGSHLVKEIENRFSEIIVVDNLTPTVHKDKSISKDLDFQLVIGDVQDSHTWQRVSEYLPEKSYELTVFHLAANTSTGSSINFPSHHVSTNVLGTSLLCEFLASRVKFLKKIILTSTRAVYGEGLWKTTSGRVVQPDSRLQFDLENKKWNPRFESELCTEPLGVSANSTIPKPVNVYGATKLAQENILQIWCRAFDVPLNILRLQNVYGPGQSLWNSYSGVITLFAKNALTDVEIELYEGGGIVRDLVYVKDVTKVLSSELGVVDSVIDVGSGNPVTLQEVATVIAQKSKYPEAKITDKFRIGDVRGIFADTTVLNNFDLATQFHTLENGISELMNWARKELAGEK
jgi:dTDP-L-rhamnose 4-epimerase